jgi:outer membrane biosynthesis protein TonB
VSNLPRVSPLAAGAALAGVAAFLLAFGFARATAPAQAHPPAVVPLEAAGGGVALPHLSQTAALPDLAAPAATPAPAPKPVRTVAPAPKPKPKPVVRKPRVEPTPVSKPVPKPAPRPKPKPVVIVGSG